MDDTTTALVSLMQAIRDYDSGVAARRAALDKAMTAYTAAIVAAANERSANLVERQPGDKERMKRLADIIRHQTAF